ncbi:Transcription elongation factor 1 isoform 2 [Theobroma cacao]|uniref:Transcription elongation factor 1 homolog n=1 Tax=Theobroma cacao TaxID=3641 RepID=A0A061F7Y6_THECC|nr:Transcription elongation factor 1 isoform 2 [Theobroma cacao]
MGKRKSRAKPPPKKRMDKLDTVFSCPFCNHGTGVECRIDMKNLIGEAVCRICQESFSTTITGMLICCCFDSNVYTVIKCKGKESFN